MPDLVKYDEIFLEKSWDWLNDPEIRKLTLSPEFSKEDQLKFFEGLPYRNDYWIKGITEDSIPIGVMGLKKIDHKEMSAEYWGYIGEKGYWGKGIGKFMLQKAIKRARALKLKFVYLNVATYNVRAKALYKKLGFEYSGTEAGLEKYILDL